MSDDVTDIDECLSALTRGSRLCSEGEVCVNEEGAYSCVCAPGLYRVTMVAADGSEYTTCASESDMPCVSVSIQP